jgi:L-malate glycosyltransferase
VIARPEPLAVQYHNITPHEFFDAWDRPVADALDWGRRQLRALANRSALGLADSHYNEAELRAAGFTNTAVVPVFVPALEGEAPVDAGTLDRLRAAKRGNDWLFVGRLAPNKAQHELVKAFASYRRIFDPGARLWLVGGDASTRYHRSLARFVAAAGLEAAVHLTGAVADPVLGAYYAAADVLVCVSRHEGFGVPLLEAMAHDVPVVARAGTAVTETVGDAGLLLDEGAPAIAVAVAAHRALADTSLRERLVAAGRRRVEQFSSARTAAALLDVLGPLATASAA